MLRQVLDFAMVTPAYPHEWFHYLAARALGLPARIEIDAKRHIARCWVTAKNDFQDTIITLAPALATPVVAAIWLAFFEVMPGETGPFTWAVFYLWIIAWLAGCWKDFQYAWLLLTEAA